ncbi:hypothetical protein ACER0A_007725 [Haloimpatiens sp. FM7315]|uniref:hypothetical protein n=1 Tax=Haloimpatiens sp. FM7315 TaxID=3298609 RepID=UPI0035A39EEA
MGIFLVVIGLLLIVINIGAIKKEKPNFKDTFHNKKEGISDYNVEIFKLRREFSETILELQKEIKDIKKEVKELKKIEEVEEENNLNAKKFSEENIKDMVEEKTVLTANTANRANGVKVLEVNKLLEEGLSIDEIAVKMNISKGEALLIKELYIK